MSYLKRIAFVLLALSTMLHAEEQRILNASYDVSRELYRKINAAFIQSQYEKTGQEIYVDQSHNGSSKQVRAVIDGLEADVVTMNQTSDMVVLEQAGLLEPNWQSAFPNQSSPYSSTILFLVRKDNPKNIQDWQDLVRDDIQIVMPNPKTSGNGRYSYLAALAFAEHHFKDHANKPQAIQDFIRQLYKNAPILETGGRAATTSFIQRQIGDVLLTFESEVLQITKLFNRDDFEIIVPSLSIRADYPVAVIAPVAKKHGTTALANQYLEFLYSKEAQQIAADFYLRPFAKEIATASQHVFSDLHLVTVDELGGWDTLIKAHFADGAAFDQIYLQ